MNEQSIFTAALERAQAERRVFLDDACADRPELRKRVERLIVSHEASVSFMDQPAGLVAESFDEPFLGKNGTRIGPYKLLEQIGTGGMGAVYVAEQKEPVRRKVALKVIKPGMDTQQVVVRFEAERQALAMMNHPNIAKVLDAGATDAGRPYFVMELVKGAPITEFCDQQRLDTRERLQLFITVCQAVQHAHQKGLIHRDIKPSNVLVEVHDVKPVPKVIDFGVAKAIGQSLTEKTLHTGFGEMVGTPLYMSPEQAGQSSIDVDTRSDIYSLGVLLYEILTGHTPFESDTLRNAGFDEMRRMIREVDPPRPSTRVCTLEAKALSTVADCRKVESRKLSQQLCGELDWIVMKALDKDRNRRYESATALAADVQRYLDDVPVLACPPSTVYRFSKFARKNRIMLTAAVVVAATLLIGTAVSTWQAVRATQAQAKANTNESKAITAGTAERAAKQSESIQRQRAEASEKQANDRLVQVEGQRDLAVQRKAMLRQYLYAADMKIASESTRNGRLGATRAILDRQLPEAGEQDLRGFAWYYLNLACEQSERTLRESLVLHGHTGDVYFVTVSLDGTLVASAGKDRTVRLWDASSGQCLHALRGHADEINCVAFAPDGKTIATASDDRTVRVWSVATGDELWALNDFSRPVVRVQFSPDGTVLASADVDLQVQECCTTLWNLSSKTITHRFDDQFILAYSPIGNLIATFSTDLAIRLVDFATGKVIHTMSGQSDVIPMGVFSSDGKHLLTGSENLTLIIWNVETGREVTRFDGADTRLRTMGLSPDGKFLAAGGNDGLVRIWHLPSHRLDRTIDVSSAIWSLAFSPDGKDLFVSDAAGTIRRCSLAPASAQVCLPEHAEAVHRVDISSDGNLLATVDQEFHACLWSLPEPALVRTIAIGTHDPEGGFHPIGFLPGNQQLLFGDSSGGIHIVETASGREVAFWPAHENGMSKGTFSLDRKVLATVGSTTVRVFNLDSRSLLGQWSPESWINSLCLSPDGASLIVVTGVGISSWDIASGAKTEFAIRDQGIIWACTFSPDGKWLATSTSDKSIRILDAKSKREHMSLLGHSDPIVTLAFSPDGATLASGGGNGELKLWDLATGQELFDLRGHTGRVEHVAFSRDGQMLVSSGSSHDGKGEVWLWFAPRHMEKDKTIVAARMAMGGECDEARKFCEALSRTADTE